MGVNIRTKYCSLQHDNELSSKEITFFLSINNIEWFRLAGAVCRHQYSHLGGLFLIFFGFCFSCASREHSTLIVDSFLRVGFSYNGDFWCGNKLDFLLCKTNKSTQWNRSPGHPLECANMWGLLWLTAENECRYQYQHWDFREKVSVSTSRLYKKKACSQSRYGDKYIKSLSLDNKTKIPWT